MQAPLESKWAANLVNVNDVLQSHVRHVHSSYDSFGSHVQNIFFLFYIFFLNWK